MIADYEDIADIVYLYSKSLDMSIKEQKIAEVFLSFYINRDIFVSCIYIDDEIVSSAMMVIQPAFYDGHSCMTCGHHGVIQNVYTVPEYRNRHFASGCINELLNLIDDNEHKLPVSVSKVKSSTDIQSICERLGFEFDDKLNMMVKYKRVG